MCPFTQIFFKQALGNMLNWSENPLQTASTSDQTKPASGSGQEKELKGKKGKEKKRRKIP